MLNPTQENGVSGSFGTSRTRTAIAREIAAISLRNRRFEKALSARVARFDERARLRFLLRVRYFLFESTQRAVSFVTIGNGLMVRPIVSLAIAIVLLANLDFALHYPDGCLVGIGLWGLLVMAIRMNSAWSPRSNMSEVLPLSKRELQRDQAIQFLYGAGFIYLDFLLVYFALAPVSWSASGSLAVASLFAVLQATVFLSVSLLLVALRINPVWPILGSLILAWLWTTTTEHPVSGVSDAIWRALLRWNPLGWLGAFYPSGTGLDRWDVWAVPVLVAGIILILPFSYRRYRRMQREGAMSVNPVELSRLGLFIRTGERVEPMTDVALMRKEIVEGDALGLRGRKESRFIGKLGDRFLSAREFAMVDALRIGRRGTNWRFGKYLAWIVIYGGASIWLRQTIHSISIDDLIRRSKLGEALLLVIFGGFLFARTALLGVSLFRWNCFENGPARRAISPGQNRVVRPMFGAQYDSKRMFRLFPVTKWELSKVIIKWNSLALPLILLPSLFVWRAFAFGILPIGRRSDVLLLTKGLILIFDFSLMIQGIALYHCAITRYSGWRRDWAWLSEFLVCCALFACAFAVFPFGGSLLSVFFLVLLLAATGGCLRYCIVKYLREC